MGLASIVWYVSLTILSEDILFDSLAALGLMISFYIGITGFACAIFYRRELLNSVKNFFFIGVGPTVGGAILFYLLIKNAIELSDPANSESGNSWFGLGPPLVIGILFAVLGIVLMLWQWRSPEFFRRRLEVAGALPGLSSSAPRATTSGSTSRECGRRSRRSSSAATAATSGTSTARIPRRARRALLRNIGYGFGEEVGRRRSSRCASCPSTRTGRTPTRALWSSPRNLPRSRPVT